VKKPVAKFNSINLLLTTLFIGSLVLTVWEIRIYQKTFIPLRIPLLIWLLTGLVFLPILRKTLATYLETVHLLLQMFYSLVTCGGLVVCAFMLSNYYLADKEIFVENERIISTGHLGSSRGHCQQPFIIIHHNDQEKQLVYYCDTPVEKYQSVDLTLSKGFLGFEIVRNTEFKND
jgi:hypothetical protein